MRQLYLLTVSVILTFPSLSLSRFLLIPHWIWIVYCPCHHIIMFTPGLLFSLPSLVSSPIVPSHQCFTGLSAAWANQILYVLSIFPLSSSNHAQMASLFENILQKRVFLGSPPLVGLFAPQHPKSPRTPAFCDFCGYHWQAWEEGSKKNLCFGSVIT